MKVCHEVFKDCSKVVVGYSGGKDSTALLHYIVSNISVDVVAVHINHKLNSKSDFWEEHCRNFCYKNNIKFFSEKICLESKNSYECEARIKRLEVFKKYGNVVALAHQNCDNVETFLFRLFRGTGLYGLNSIQKTSYVNGLKIIRPLLESSKQDVYSYCEKHCLEYVDDPSNSDIKYSRNFIRNLIIPLLNTHFTNFNSRINTLINEIKNQNNCCRDLAEIDFAANSVFVNSKNCISVIKIVENNLPEYRIKNLLYFYLQKNNVVASGKGLCEFVKSFLKQRNNNAELIVKDNFGKKLKLKSVKGIIYLEE